MKRVIELLEDEIGQTKEEIRKASRNDDEDEKAYQTGYKDGLEIALKWAKKYGGEE